MKNLFLFVLLLLSFSGLMASDDAKKLLGENITTDAVAEWFELNEIVELNSSRYASPKGIEVLLQENTVQEIRFYHKHELHGAYTGSLPDKLSFGMSTTDVKKLLGKPKVEYQKTGFMEYVAVGINLSCWFENSRLVRVAISVAQ